MGVLTGSDGQLRYNGSTVGKCREWSLSIAKDAIEDTTIGSYDRTYVEGLRGTTGSATILYDPNNQTAVSLLNSIFKNGEPNQNVNFVFNRKDGTSFHCESFITSVTPTVSVGAVQAVSVGFQVTDKPYGGF